MNFFTDLEYIYVGGGVFVFVLFWFSFWGFFARQVTVYCLDFNREEISTRGQYLSDL